jgi:uncharacterized membrane protein YgdD (TMEM256/DUF423 family)
MPALLALAAFNGLLAVALGAFGAHGLRRRLADAPDGPRRLEWWQLAASYHLSHALATGLAALARERLPGPLPNAAAWAFALGSALFSGSLYVMGVTGVRKLGAITPIGGLCLLVGWGCLLGAALAAW